MPGVRVGLARSARRRSYEEILGAINPFENRIYGPWAHIRTGLLYGTFAPPVTAQCTLHGTESNVQLLHRSCSSKNISLTLRMYTTI